MAEAYDIEVVVFDILGTMVDEPGGIRAAIREAVPAVGDVTAAGLRWHQALSAEDAQAYKPAPEVYRLALDAAGCPAERVLMVAAHAWDLRGVQALGMRTACVRRPVGDPPKGTGTFDLRSNSLDELVAGLT